MNFLKCIYYSFFNRLLLMFWSCCLSSLWLFVLDFVAASSHFSFKLSRAFSRRFKSLMSLKYTIPADVCFRQTEIRDRLDLYLVGGNEMREIKDVFCYMNLWLYHGVCDEQFGAPRDLLYRIISLLIEKKERN